MQTKYQIGDLLIFNQSVVGYIVNADLLLNVKFSSTMDAHDIYAYFMANSSHLTNPFMGYWKQIDLFGKTQGNPYYYSYYEKERFGLTNLLMYSSLIHKFDNIKHQPIR